MSVTPISSSAFDTLSAANPQATTKAAASSTSTDTTSATASTTNLSSTFLQLLTQELQNQDPTAPMDSTQMVGQMISLNQLEQLASINQTLTKNTAVTTTSAAAATTSAAAAQAAIQAASMGNTLGATASSVHGAVSSL